VSEGAESDGRGLESALDRVFGASRLPVFAVAVPALSALAISIVIFLQRAATPITGDGALVIAERYPLTLKTLLYPFHFQLIALPVALWAPLDGPAPKLALLLCLHVALTALMAAFLVSRLGPAQGVALTLPLAVLGSAAYDLVTPLQIAFVLPMLLVVAATWLSVARTDRGLIRRAGVAICLVLAVLSSNVGMVAIFAFGLWFLLERRWTQLVELVPAALGAVFWLVRFGIRYNRDHIAHAQAFTSASPDAVPIYILSGMTNGIGGWFGFGGPRVATIAGIVLIVAFLGYVIARRVQVPPAFFSFFAATFAMFAALSLLRSNADPGQAAGSRYTYLVLFMLAAGIGAAAPKLPASRLLVAVGIIAAVFNAGLLFEAIRGP
jgi:hypothetical protein